MQIVNSGFTDAAKTFGVKFVQEPMEISAMDTAIDS